ncbi:MAG: hypothetical protein ACKO50_14485 [Cyanobium sp.]
MTTGYRSVSVCGPVIFTVVIGLAATGADPSAAPAAAPALTAERVLVIDQEGPTRPAFVQFMDGFRAGLAAGPGRCDVFIENLDLARLDRTADDPERAAGWLVAKYGDWSFDVIVPTSEVTRDFVLANRERLSPAARIVGLQRPGDRPAPQDHAADYTFATTDSTMGATVELACQVFPGLKRIALVSQSIPHPGLLALQVEQVRTVAKEKGIEYLPLVDLPIRRRSSAAIGKTRTAGRGCRPTCSNRSAASRRCRSSGSATRTWAVGSSAASALTPARLARRPVASWSRAGTARCPRR